MIFKLKEDIDYKREALKDYNDALVSGSDEMLAEKMSLILKIDKTIELDLF